MNGLIMLLKALFTTRRQNVAQFVEVIVLYFRSAQFPSTRLPRRLNLVRWCLTWVGPQYGTCFMSSFRHQVFWGGLYIFGVFVDPTCLV